MDFWVPIFTSCIATILAIYYKQISTCLCGKLSYIWEVNENLIELRTGWNVLIGTRNNVLSRVEAGEQKGEQPLATVYKWLLEVAAIETDINRLLPDAFDRDTAGQGVSSNDAFDLDTTGQGVSSNDLSDGDTAVQGVSSNDSFDRDAATQGVSSNDSSTGHQRLPTSGCWSTDEISNCCLGREVFKTLNEVRRLSSRGTFEVVTVPAPPPVVVKRNVKQTLIGHGKKFTDTWKSVMKNIKVGIHGMGGVGKTTLLTLINNEFDKDIFKHRFDVVIWVKVCKDGDVGKIQDTIGERLRICDENWSTDSNSNKAVKIDRALTKKPRFVLLLDGLWEEVSLSEIGIPVLGKLGGKVVFTTRTTDVCVRMGVKEDTDACIKVEFLAPKDARDLFMLMAKCSTSTDKEILDIAEKIAAKCLGLPLALQVIGKTMISKHTVDQWSRTLETLEAYPSDLKGTDKIYQVLQLSYDNLRDDAAKLCFQYCALFPKAYNIKRDELVEYWIGEGILDGNDIRERARAKRLGDETVDILVGADLLLEEDESKQKVYMHDMIRDMALWIVSKFEHGERFVVRTDAGLRQLPDVVDWITVTKMSLMNNDIENIHDDPFPDQASLKTLFLQKNKLVDIVGRFFQVLSTLVVLDLSNNNSITKLPEEISMLVDLRYLSLSGTRIKHLPCGLRELIRLIHLDLEATSDLQNINLVSGLLKLQVLRFYDSRVSLDAPLMEILEALKDLEVLTITVRDVIVLEAFLGSILAEKTHGLYLEVLEVPAASFAAIARLGSLRNLEMANCRITESGNDWEGSIRDQSSPSTSSNHVTPSNTWFKKISVVVLLSCVHLKDLTWLIYAKNLESLSVESSPEIEELINREKVADDIEEPFQNLRSLRLYYLGELRSFDRSPLSFPKLKRNKVDIVNCPNLDERYLSLCF